MKLSACVLVVTLASTSMAPPPGLVGASRLPFTADDYKRARTEAIGRRLPLFVEVWAPW